MLLEIFNSSLASNTTGELDSFCPASAWHCYCNQKESSDSLGSIEDYSCLRGITSLTSHLPPSFLASISYFYLEIMPFKNICHVSGIFVVPQVLNVKVAGAQKAEYSRT